MLGSFSIVGQKIPLSPLFIVYLALQIGAVLSLYEFLLLKIPMSVWTKNPRALSRECFKIILDLVYLVSYLNLSFLEESK